MKRSAICLVAAFFMTGFTGSSNLAAQEGVSSFSMGMSRAGLIPEFSQIRIEEYINYHRHQIPRPEGDQAVRLDLKWNRLEGDKAVVQVGMATSNIARPELMPPMNLVLVIDRSGSMSGDRIANVKKSLLSFVEKLRPTDLVTIVGFSDSARVELEPCHKTKQNEIRQAIERIEAGGSTNLHGGLMLGYKIAEQNFDLERTNRVILLTDGIANVGTTAPDEISAQSKAFNKKGISFSTIGLGHDLNQNLLRDLADAGHGLIHFVDDAADIEKTFITELDSLLAPAARKVRLTINSPTAQPTRIFGYEAKEKGDAEGFRLDDLNRGATQIVLSEWDLPDSPIQVRATLDYTDAVTGEKIEQTALLTLNRNDARKILDDADLCKSYSIAILADALRESVRLFHASKAQQAIKKLNRAIKFVEAHDQDDVADVGRMVEIVRDHRQKMKATLEITQVKQYE